MLNPFKRVSAQELCERGGGAVDVPDSPYGLCGRKASLKREVELSSHTLPPPPTHPHPYPPASPINKRHVSVGVKHLTEEVVEVSQALRQGVGWGG